MAGDCLARKIKRGKWAEAGRFSGKTVAADTVTAELKTTGNTLSFWSVTEDTWQEAALAMMAAGDRLDAVDIVWLPTETLTSADIQLEETPGSTPVADLTDTHIDASDLDAESLARVAGEMAWATREDKTVARLTKSKVRELLNQAISDGRLRRDDLSESLANSLGA